MALPPVKFTFKYLPKLIEGLEENPQIVFFLSKNVGQDTQNIDLKTDDHSVSLNISTNTIPADATLSYWVFVETKNSRGQPSVNEAGSGWVYLKEILNQKKPIVVTQPLVVFNARRQNVDGVKGALQMSFDKVAFPNGESPFEPVKELDLVMENKEAIRAVYAKKFQASQAIFSLKEPTFEGLGGLRLPTWDTNTWQLFGECFSMVRARHSPEAVWTNLLDMALRRHLPHMSLNGANSYLTHLSSEEEKVTIAAKMVGIWINYQTYLSDGIPVVENKQVKARFGTKKAIGHQSMEAFSSNIRDRVRPLIISADGQTFYVPAGADCEDGAAEQCFELMELINRKDWKDERLKMLSDLLGKNYLVLQVLMGVRGAQLSDGDKGKNAYKGLGGHMAGAIMSRETFLKLHKRYNAVDEPYEGFGIGDSATSSQRSPIQMLEGTGLIDPGASEHYAESFKTYKYLADGNGFGCKYIAPQSRTEINNFYRAWQSFCVLNLVDEGFSNPEHILIKTKKNGDKTWGASHLDVISEAATIATAAQPPMTSEEIQLTKNLLSQTNPISPFKPPRKRVEDKAHHPILEDVKQKLKAYNRPEPEDFDIVQLYPAYWELKDIKNAWLQMIKNKVRCYKMSYTNEEVSEGMGGYHVRFFVAKE